MASTRSPAAPSQRSEPSDAAMRAGRPSARTADRKPPAPNGSRRCSHPAPDVVSRSTASLRHTLSPRRVVECLDGDEAELAARPGPGDDHTLTGEREAVVPSGRLELADVATRQGVDQVDPAIDGQADHRRHRPRRAGRRGGEPSGGIPRSGQGRVRTSDPAAIAGHGDCPDLAAVVAMPAQPQGAAIAVRRTRGRESSRRTPRRCVASGSDQMTVPESGWTTEYPPSRASSASGSVGRMRITTTSPAGSAHDAWCCHSGAPVDRANASTKPRVASTTTPSVVTPAMSGAPLMRIVHAGAGLESAVRLVHQRSSTGSGVQAFVATRTWRPGQAS